MGFRIYTPLWFIVNKILQVSHFCLLEALCVFVLQVKSSNTLSAALSPVSKAVSLDMWVRNWRNSSGSQASRWLRYNRLQCINTNIKHAALPPQHIQ